VLDAFRCHMTLSGRTDRLAEDRMAALSAHAEAYFAPLEQPIRVDALSLFVEPQPGAALTRLASFELAR
jgi:hypothetical protein